MPTVEDTPPNVANLVSARVATASSPEFKFTVNSDAQTRQDIIFASSGQRPTSPDSDAPITKHNVQGSMTLDLTKTFLEGSTGSGSDAPFTDNQKLFAAHAVFCGLGFLLFPPAGALLARLFRTFTPTWFKGHWIIQFASGGPVIMIGFIMAIAAVQNKSGAHFANTPHKRVGLVLILLYIAQCSLGAFIHFVKPKVFNGRPPQNYVHAVLGLMIIALAFYQVHTGYDDAWPTTGRETPSGVNIVFYIWVVLMPLLYCAGLALLPKQFRQERQYMLTRGGSSEDMHELRASR